MTSSPRCVACTVDACSALFCLQGACLKLGMVTRRAGMLCLDLGCEPCGIPFMILTLPPAQDPNVVEVVLLLTGSVEGMKAQTAEYLSECLSCWTGICGEPCCVCNSGRELAWVQLAKDHRLEVARGPLPCAPAETFSQYEFLWRTDLQAEYEAFMRSSPTLEDCEAQLKRIMAVEQVRSRGGCLHGPASMFCLHAPLRLAKGQQLVCPRPRTRPPA